jgi:general stress protein YciG
MAATGKGRQGFASMDPRRVREIAHLGGKAVQEQRVGHQWTTATAQAAGRKGGAKSRGGRGKAPASLTTPRRR